MKQTNNEDIAKEIASEVYEKLCSFYHNKMIHVPECLNSMILESSKVILNQHIKHEFDGKSVKDLLHGRGDGSKASSVLEVLRDKGTKYVWTIKELSKKASVSTAAVHKLKHRLLFLEVIELKGKMKQNFHLTEQGKRDLDTIFPPVVTN